MHNTNPRDYITSYHIDYALNELQTAGLLADDESGQENRKAVVDGFGNPHDIAVSLIKLNNLGLLKGKYEQSNRYAVAKHCHPNALWVLIDTSVQTGWLTLGNKQHNFDQLIFNAVVLSSPAVLMAFFRLEVRFIRFNGKLTTEQFATLMNAAEEYKHWNTGAEKLAKLIDTFKPQTYPSFLKTLKVKPTHLTPEKVAHALWLKDKSEEQTCLAKSSFNMWAKTTTLSFGIEEVDVVLAKTYQMKK